MLSNKNPAGAESCWKGYESFAFQQDLVLRHKPQKPRKRLLTRAKEYAKMYE
jgi:hypothetical protein